MSDVENRGRWELFRDMAVFQVKLLLDGVRDVLLSPISLLATLVGLLTETERPGRYFYDLLRYGRQTDRWIDLFGAQQPGGPPGDRPGEPRDPALSRGGVDDFVSLIEDTLVREVERGGMTATAKESVDKLLDRIQGKPGPERAAQPRSFAILSSRGRIASRGSDGSAKTTRDRPASR